MVIRYHYIYSLQKNLQPSVYYTFTVVEWGYTAQIVQYILLLPSEVHFDKPCAYKENTNLLWDHQYWEVHITFFAH